MFKSLFSISLKLLQPVLTVFVARIARSKINFGGRLRVWLSILPRVLAVIAWQQESFATQTALGSLNEVDMALKVAIALGYIDSLDRNLARAIVDAGRMLASLAKR